mgnify:CR=1 FL=1
MPVKTYRPIIIFTVIMLIFHFATPSFSKVLIKNSKYSKYFEKNFRFGEIVDKVATDGFFEYIKSDNNYKVVFVGDSVIAGALVEDNNDTIPAYFQKNFEYRVSVYNLGFPGNRPADIFFSTKKIIDEDACDFIILNVNYAFFSDSMLEKSSIARPKLFFDIMDTKSRKVLNLEDNKLETFLVTNLLSKWNIYKKREEISFSLFGQNLREKLIIGEDGLPEILDENNALTTPVNYNNTLDTPWYETNFPPKKIEHWKNIFDTTTINDDNIGVYFFKKTLDKISSENIPAIVFLTPTNKEMIESLHLIKDYSRYEKNMSFLKNMINKKNIRLIDCTNIVESENFCDLYHLMPSGNQKLAQILFEESKDMIKKE